MTESTAQRIPLLTDTNYSTWLVDIRAILRQKKLWEAVQEPLTSESTKAIVTKHEEAADIVTITISASVKQRLVDSEFNDAYLMLTKLQTLFAPATEQTFMQSIQELFSISPRKFNNMEAFLTQIKVLNERIESTNLKLTSDKRTLLVLMMSLASYSDYRSLVQVWAATDGITGERAITQLREEIGRTDLEEPDTRGSALFTNRPGSECSFCKKPGHNEDNCWKKYPEKIPDWVHQNKVEKPTAMRIGYSL